MGVQVYKVLWTSGFLGCPMQCGQHCLMLTGGQEASVLDVGQVGRAGPGLAWPDVC